MVQLLEAYGKQLGGGTPAPFLQLQLLVLFGAGCRRAAAAAGAEAATDETASAPAAAAPAAAPAAAAAAAAPPEAWQADADRLLLATFGRAQRSTLGYAVRAQAVKAAAALASPSEGLLRWACCASVMAGMMAKGVGSPNISQ